MLLHLQGCAAQSHFLWRIYSQTPGAIGKCVFLIFPHLYVLKFSSRCFVFLFCRDLVLCTAIVIVLFTSFFNGTLTEPLIRWLNITTNVDMSDYLKVR